ncbi:T9SS type A sorting domain-containing protein [Pelobium manganitolerans]|uniref:T9SS type A sorting domain-containing protein n=1 Tax=Pelobium manganitolerans TaxID=1842495 RepID=UPI003FA35327
MKKILPILFVLSLSSAIVKAQCTPPGELTITGPSSGCTDRVTSYTVKADGATSYVWEITGTNTKTQQSQTQYNIVFENSAVTIKVTPMNGSCAGTAKTLVVPVSPTPSRPVISQSGNTLDANTSASSYQWYQDSKPIAGATAQTFTPTVNGTYLVEAKNSQGCNSFSTTFNFFKTAITEDAVFNGFVFYPNPVTTVLNVDFAQAYDLSFMDLLGREVLQKDNLRGKQELDLTALKRGVYLMKINSNGKTAVRKLFLK